MHKIILVLSLLVAPLSACAPLGALLQGDSLAQTAPEGTADAEKALAIAHLAYQGIGITLKQAADSGALHGADAAAAKALYDKAGAALDTADAADAAANAPGILAAVADAETAIARLHDLTSH
jgi:hypothetical protein